MTSFLELAQLNTLSKPEWTYDIAFIGSPIDDRGRLSVTKAKEAAQRTAVVSYDAETFTLSVNDVRFAANNRGFRNLISDYPASRILLDASTLEFPEMLLLIKAFLSTEPLELGFLYVEPESYEERRGPETEDLHAFALREEYRAFAPIPGFTPMLSDTRKARLLAFVGFESTRLKRVIHEDEGARISAFSVVFGVPPFRASWEMHSFMQNSNILKESAFEEVLFVGANNPRATYNLISKVAGCCPNSEVMTIAPLGTKPMSIGAALYAAQNAAGIRVIYDYPKTRPDCTHGIGKIHHYTVRVPAIAAA